MVTRIVRTTVWAAALFGITGCVHEDDSTQITIAVTTETAIPKELDQFTLNVTDAQGSVRTDLTYDVATQSFFPQTLAVFPQNAGSLDAPFQVSVQGQAGATQVVLRSATVSYVAGRTLLLPMSLRMACFEVFDCKADESCVGGECVPATVDSTSLLDYSDALVFAADAPTCFDEATCLDTNNKKEVVFQGTGCTFPIPAGDVNVAIQWDAALARAIALPSNDPREGWTRIDSTTAELSPGVCAAKNAAHGVSNRANAVYTYTGCAAKTATVPYCGAGIGTPL
jgi:hypothetical protein